ncbi:MAG TPA: DUF1947 domain-containing protein [Candidatus Bathyarchaeota archaeon]|nr:DUF1947 domain-containing protein [Candidatus Bathyarchaeota archaeon]
MNKILKRHFLKSKEVRKLMAEIKEKLKISRETFGKNPKIEVAEFNGIKIFIFDSKPLIASHEDALFPTLIFDDSLRSLPKVIVDMGAVPHICNGADVMAPGMVELEGKFCKGDLIAVLDEKNRKLIAVGMALKDSEEIVGAKRGRVVKNLHYVGDKLWRLIKSLSS